MTRFDDTIKAFDRHQSSLEEWARTLGRGKYGRVLRMSRKPTPDEFSKSATITAIGMILVGGLGFLVYYLWTYAPDWFSRVFGLG